MVSFPVQVWRAPETTPRASIRHNMSSGFVPGGTAEEPIQRDDAWLKAQAEAEANRRRKEEDSRQDGGKSLYDVLQQNKGVSLPSPSDTSI